MKRYQANMLLLLAGAMWGMGFIAQSTAMDSIEPFLFIGSRFLLAFIVVLPFALRESRKATQPLTAANKKLFVLIGCVMFAGMATQQFGLLTTTVTNSGFLTGLYVIFTPLIAILLFKTWPNPIVWPASLLALAGIGMLSGLSLSGLTNGDWLTILCAVIWATQMSLISRGASASGRPITLAVTQFGITAVLGLLAAAIFEPISLEALRGASFEILYAGIFSGGIAFTLQVIGQRHTGASQAAILLSTEALFAALFAAIFLGDRLPALGLVGCGFIFLAVLMVEVIPSLRKAMISPQA